MNYKIKNTEGLTEEQISELEALMNNRVATVTKVAVTSAVFLCTDFTIKKIVDAVLKVAFESAKLNPFAKIAIGVGSSVISFVAGDIVSKKVEELYDDISEGICKLKLFGIGIDVDVITRDTSEDDEEETVVVKEG